MGSSITLNFEGKNELLLRAIEAYEQSDLFEDEDGNSVRLSREEIALNMLLEGCIQWVQDVPGLPEELEDTIRETFAICDDECDDDCECDDELDGGDTRYFKDN